MICASNSEDIIEKLCILVSLFLSINMDIMSRYSVLGTVFDMIIKC